MSGQVMNTELQRKISVLMSGMKTTVASEKVARGESLDVGKRSMSFAAYSTMCDLMYHGGDDEYLFAHCFLTLQWNLMTVRSDNCVNMEINTFELLGAQPGNLGSHSTRKGAITLVSSGYTVSPPMGPICL
jgi:hypothetical protein